MAHRGTTGIDLPTGSFAYPQFMATPQHLADTLVEATPAWTEEPSGCLRTLWHPGPDALLTNALVPSPLLFKLHGILIERDFLVSLSAKRERRGLRRGGRRANDEPRIHTAGGGSEAIDGDQVSRLAGARCSTGEG